jgi:phosphohistidine phosphatase
VESQVIFSNIRINKYIQVSLVNYVVAMKTLLILRHARAVSKDLNLSDHDRPLDKLGENDALHMGKLMKDKDITPSFIISSTAVRAKTTAELVAKGCSYQGDIVLNQSLYEAKPKDYLLILNTLSDKYNSVLIVGHNPTVEDTIQMLTYSAGVLTIPSCVLAHLSLPIERWSGLSKNNVEQHDVVLREIIQPR